MNEQSEQYPLTVLMNEINFVCDSNQRFRWINDILLTGS